MLGVFGGGQLGRMFGLAARRMGFRFAVFAPEVDGPASQIADWCRHAPYDDLAAVQDFAQRVDAVSFEFENVPAVTAVAAAEHVPVRPNGDLLHMAQNRIREKRGLQRAGLPVAPFAEIEPAMDRATIVSLARELDGAMILKTASSGYDGKGQIGIDDPAGAEAAFEQLGRVPCVLEKKIAFRSEISVVGARAVDGSVALYPPIWNEHRNHILDVSVCPAPLPEPVIEQARAHCRTVLEELDVVGVLCVEFFALADGSLLVNEIAPRPHNSGHLTIEAAHCDQFEQQVRAVAGWPLGSAELRSPAAMANLLGDLWNSGEPDFERAVREPGVHLHLYGKESARVGRKMGHLTVLDPRGEQAAERVRAARDLL